MFLQNSNSTGRVLDNASEIGNVAWQSINNLLAGIIERLPFIIAGILVAAIFFLFAKFVKKIFLATTTRANLDERLRLLFSRLIVVVIAILGIFTAFTVVVPSFGFGDLIAGIGLTTFVIGFATKDILNNLLSGVLILWQEPFKKGDQLFIDKIQGRVEYIGVRATSLRKDDGELVLIPNGDMYSGMLTIRGAGSKRRMNLDVKVGYEADIDNAKATIRNSLIETDGVVSEPPPNVFVSDLAAEGANITVNFWLNANEARPREVFDRAATGIMKSLTRSGVELYPPGAVVIRGANGVGQNSDTEDHRAMLEN
ncbi:mechanosensitive ion channel family protein [soil metagenome]